MNSMNLEYLNTEGIPGNEYYEDNTRYIPILYYIDQTKQFTYENAKCLAFS